MRRSSYSGASTRRVSQSTPGTGRRSSAGAPNIAYTSVRSSGSSTGNESSTSQRSSLISLLPSKAAKLLDKIPLPSPDETMFMGLVSTGNVSGATDFLKERATKTDFDVNKANFDGYTALHMAVHIQDLDMVKLLFTETEVEIELFDAFFYAIKEGDLAMVHEFVHFQIQRSDAVAKDASGTPVVQTETERKETELAAIQLLLDSKDATINSEFDVDITPLMLAAHCGSFDIIKYFFQVGERLEPISQTDKHQKYGDLLSSYVRVHTFQAIANPIYISFICMEFVSVDPVYEAFALIEQLRQFAVKDPEVRMEYEKLIVELGEFAKDLLGLCRTGTEVELLLSQPMGYRESTGEKFPRLALAVELEQKEFVSHPHTQTALREQWTEGFTVWKQYGSGRRLWEFIWRTITLPLISLYLCVQSNCVGPCGSIRRRLSAPVSYFMHDLASYFFFLGLLIVEASLLNHDPNDKSPPRDSKRFGFSFWRLQLYATACKKFKPIAWVNHMALVFHLITEAWIVFFVVGQLVSSLTQIWYLRTRYFTRIWNLYEIITQALFVTAFSFSLAAWILAPPLENINHGEFGMRKYWGQYEPLLVAESFYVLGVTMSFGRILRVLQLNRRYGPLQIALGKMLISITKAFALYAVVIFAFAQGMCIIYKGYGDQENVFDEDDKKEKTFVSDAYTSFPSAVETLFWGLFGMAGLENTNIIHFHHNNTHTGKIQEVHHYWTQSAGRILYAVFHIFATTILLNTIVAMMTGSADEIFGNMDMEWKFGRTKVWMFYANGMKYPVPFNTLAIFRRCCTKKDKYTEAYQTRYFKTNNSILVKDLVRRYFHAKEAIGQDEQATRDHVAKLREAVSNIKEIVKEDRKKKLVAGAVSRFMSLKKSVKSRTGDTK